MNVFHIVRDTGGVIKLVSELANYQVESGDNVFVLCSGLADSHTKLFCSEVNLIEINHKLNFPPLLFGLRTNKIIQKHTSSSTTSVVHYHNVATVGLFNYKYMKNSICTIHGLSWYNESLRTKISKWVTRRIIKRIIKSSGAVVGVSRSTSTYYNQLCNFDKVITIYNGISNKNHKKAQSKKFRIAHIGDVSENKGWELTMGAVLSLSSDLKEDVEFIIAGRIIGVTESEITNLINENCDHFEIKYLGIVDDAYKNLVPSVDLLILPSISEGLPMSIIECQSLGIPVIATDVGGISEIIIDDYNGYIVKRDSNQIREKIEYLIRNKDLYLKFSINSQRRFNEGFSIDVTYKTYNRVYHEVSERSKL